MSLAITFGSFGDIVTLIQLSAQVISLLTSTCGSSESYQSLILDVSRLQSFLKQLDAAISALDGPSVKNQSSFKEAIASMEACRTSLERIQRRITWNQVRLQKMAGKSWVDMWRRVGWGLFKEAEIEGFRKEIQSYNMLIVQILASINQRSLQILRSDLTDTKDLIHENTATITTVECDVKIILRILQNLDGRLPSSLGYPWETDMDTAMPYEDIFGRRYLVPQCLFLAPYTDPILTTAYQAVQMLHEDFGEDPKFSRFFAQVKTDLRTAHPFYDYDSPGHSPLPFRRTFDTAVSYVLLTAVFQDEVGEILATLAYVLRNRDRLIECWDAGAGSDESARVWYERPRLKLRPRP
ncbi:hypothetical protein JAAARDRAFT_56926 [Jaapia argillacea MUCL 33604]|uniref:Azaphilone pigments biosynthesis cluster protein L N-terminal domain-containing protein n=1 Tax=Jaapia argillacea MUCL 33604 TaxID=933084 RepID=A0A067PW43_9AGAM|nr:hypothetical protein JAAARDRAFT_56926 [Jaapia argillacea MUCL 33604]